jgi:two-component system chemotaxis response regulator CheB
MVVDDTILYRKLVSDTLSAFPDIELVGTAATGDIALHKLEQTPVDLVFCDVYMPGRNGLETLVEIQKKFPKIIVVMMSGLSTRNADIVVKALEQGALDFIRKPQDKSLDANVQQLRADLTSVLSLARIRMNFSGAIRSSASPAVKPAASAPTAPDRIVSASAPKTFSVLAIGVSTGGPEALTRLIPALPKNLPVPVVLVQHMPPMFTKSLADSLARKSKLLIVEAEDAQILKAGTVYIAPGGRHMILRQTDAGVQIGLNDGPPENSCRPSVDVLFRSVAAIYGGKGILSAILTGMGSDGANGVRAMKRKGCFSITQSASSCVVYGMPRAVDEAGLSDVSLPIEEIAGEMCRKLNCPQM